MTCKYCKDEICTNVDSPACADYCPKCGRRLKPFDEDLLEERD